MLSLRDRGFSAMENQTVEWKSKWDEKYLKWICGFANAQGGTIEIGKNDDGNIVPIKELKKLFTDLPNNINNTLGIIADVNHIKDNNSEYIRIVVKPSPTAVTYKGIAYYRTGTTLQELKGSALLEFMMKKQGITWDSTTVDNVTLQDLDNESFNEFRKKAIKSGRLSVDDLKVTDEELLDLLGLRAKGKLAVAAVLLFHKNPEKFILGSYVKIGFFANDSDLRYQDEVYGPLVMLPDKIIELLYLKYFKGWITYEGLIRVENYPAPQEAM
jgi:ATP-dependent DNA helicase RecG